MSLVFLKAEEIQEPNILNSLSNCQGKTIIYGEKMDDRIQGIILVDVTKHVEIKWITLFDKTALPALVEGVKNKYKNKDILIAAELGDLSAFGFVEGVYRRADHPEDAFLNLDQLVERYPVKLSEKQIVLAYLIQKFEEGVCYTESEVNVLLKSWITFEDYVTLRRDLIDFGYLKRQDNGAVYIREDKNE